MRLSICDDNIVDDNESVRLSAKFNGSEKVLFQLLFFFLSFFFFYIFTSTVVPSMRLKLVHRDGNCVELREI